MPDREFSSILSEYAARRDDFLALARVAERAIIEVLSSEDVPFENVSSRVKSEQSLRRKLINQEKAGYASLAEVTDICGLRVVTLYDDDVDLVCNAIRKHFEIDDANSVDKRALLAADRFGYASVHFVATIPEQRVRSLDGNAPIGLKLEIQVRSVTQHAWAVMHHEAGYKRSGLPDAIRRRHNRLSALLELAGQELMALRGDTFRSHAEWWASVRAQRALPQPTPPLTRESLAALATLVTPLQQLDADIASVYNVPLANLSERESITLRLLPPRLAMLGISDLAEVERLTLARRVDVLNLARRLASAVAKGRDIVSPGAGILYALALEEPVRSSAYQFHPRHRIRIGDNPGDAYERDGGVQQEPNVPYVRIFSTPAHHTVKASEWLYRSSAGAIYRYMTMFGPGVGRVLREFPPDWRELNNAAFPILLEMAEAVHSTQELSPNEVA